MKISSLKKANQAASQKSSKTKKLQNRKRVKYNKKKTEATLLSKKAVTFYDLKKQRAHEKEQKVAKHDERGKKRKKPEPEKEEEDLAKDPTYKIPMSSDRLEEAEDVLNPETLDALIREEDERFEQLINQTVDDTEEAEPEPEREDLLEEDSSQTLEEETEAEREHRNKSCEATQAKEEAAVALEREKEELQKVRSKSLLPIKIQDKIIPQMRQLSEGDDSGIDDETGKKKFCSGVNSIPLKGLAAPPPDPSDPSTPKVILPTVSELDIRVQRKAKLYDKKVFIGNQAPAIIANPDEKMGGLLGIVKMMFEVEDDIALTVRNLAARSLVEIFSHILPSYRLGTLDNPGQKLKRDTRELAVREAKLLSRYKYFLKGLETLLDRALFKKYAPVELRLAALALDCFCKLLIRRPVFNYSDSILALIVPYLSHKEPSLRAVVTDSISSMFATDDNGLFSIRILKVISSYVHKQQFQVHTDAFRTLLRLRITRAKPLDETTHNKITSNRDRVNTENNLKKLRTFNIKMSVTEKKRKRKIAILEHKTKELREVEHRAQEDSIHTDLLTVVFGLYVHVVKNDINRKLLGVVLEGLASFGHLVNVEYFSTLLRNLERVLIKQKLSPTETIHCVQTVFKLLSGLGSTLPNDPSNFSDKLYAVICKLNPTDQDIPAVVPALRTVVTIFIGCRNRVASKQSIGYVKRLATLAMSLTHSDAIPTLLTTRSLMLSYRDTECLLDTTCEGGSGVYQSSLHHPLHCNATVATLWEVTALGRSYHPMTRQVAVHISKGAPLLGDGCLPASFTKLNVDEVHRKYVDITAPLEPLQHCGPLHWSAPFKKTVITLGYNGIIHHLCNKEDEKIDLLVKPAEVDDVTSDTEQTEEQDDEEEEADEEKDDQSEESGIEDEEVDQDDVAELTDNEDDDNESTMSDDDFMADNFEEKMILDEEQDDDDAELESLEFYPSSDVVSLSDSGLMDNKLTEDLSYFLLEQ